jgi:hypothetical protein
LCIAALQSIAPHLTNTTEGTTMKRILAFAVSILGSVAVWAAPPPVFPIPIRGGDQIPPPINAFAPGPPALAFDGLNAEPFVITNISGVTAMGYTLGQATDSAGTASPRPEHRDLPPHTARLY